MQGIGRLFAVLTLTAVAGVTAAQTTNSSVPITITFSPAFESRLRSDYGPKEGEVLRSVIADALRSATAGSGARGIAVEVVLESAKPTHPTPQQLGRDPGLDFLRSISQGGAELTATVRGSDGRALGQVTYSYYAPTLQLASRAGEAWADARLSIQRFATAVAAKIKSLG
jgi:hypothetical protein